MEVFLLNMYLFGHTGKEWYIQIKTYDINK